MTRRLRLRTQVLAGVLSITLLALAAFDIAAVSALHRYLVGRTNSNLQSALTLTQPRLNLMVSDAMAAQRHQIAAPGEYDISFVPAGHKQPVVLEYGVRMPTIPLSVVYAVDRPGFARLTGAKVRNVAAAENQALAWNLARNIALIRNDAWVRYSVVARTAQAKAQATVKATTLPRPEVYLAGASLYQAESVAVPAGTLVASTSLNDVNATVNRFRLIVIIGSAAVGLLIFGGIVLVMRRGLRPIETMATQADRITAGDLDHRVDHAEARSEVGRLATALNGMLTRIEADVAQREAGQEHMQRFFADASHELRTPLASLRANAELYQQGALRERSQIDEAMRRIALEAQRMSHLVDDMLRLARLDQRPAWQHEVVDVAELVQTCLQRAKVADPDRTWQADLVGDLTTAGDEELLRRAIDNLLANVRTHTPQGTTATVTADICSDRITIAVSDDGPGVPPDQLPRVFDRFYRAGAPTQRPGSGLGLAIVAEIAATHGGTAEADLTDQHGFRVTITLPVTQESTADEESTVNAASTAQSRASAVV